MKPGAWQFFSTLTGRLLVSAILWSLAALAIGGLALSFVFRSYVLSDVDQRLSMLIDTMVGISEISSDGVLRFNRPLFDQRFTTPYSGLYWQISEEGQDAFRSRSLWDYELDNDLEHRSFSIHFIEAEGPDGQRLRMAERDIILPEADRLFHYQVATDMVEVQSAIDRFNWMLVGALGLIMLTVTLALVLQVSYGLRPLRKIGRSLAEIRAGKESRIVGSWPHDLKPLAQEINALLDQNEQLVDRARTHVGNLAHALKTPLSVIQNDVEGKGDERSRRIAEQSKLILDHIDHHLKRARIAGGGSGKGLPIAERLQKLVRAVEIMTRDKGITYDLTCPKNLKFDGEKQDFDEVLGNLIDNAGKWAKAHVVVKAISVEDNRRAFLEIRVEDDGPGVPVGELETLFERGRRLDERVPGTGLGLSIVRDIVEMYGGSAHLDRSALGGLTAIIRLPAKVA
ncbi:ATP-binding protein [Kordiimonas pumila]|uniref:histidine kinase n=1 Tax=Kordiimonas pumila TaxID=2161677 RepID=A0ABV7D8R1_9PROT|nr:HAMP domain-containing sensor histidine kinase [Kordiimonas pumila]